MQPTACVPQDNLVEPADAEVQEADREECDKSSEVRKDTGAPLQQALMCVPLVDGEEAEHNKPALVHTRRCLV
jgi:hypothetical protein